MQSALIVAGYAIPLLVVLLLRTRGRASAAAVAAVVAVLAIRAAMFQAEPTWELIREYAYLVDLTYREKQALRFRAGEFDASNESRYYAVGSSQSDRIYRRLVTEREDVDMFYLAGMGPLDYYLNRRYIARQPPRTILLHLSGFDMGALPLGAMRFAEAQGLTLVELFRTFGRFAPEDVLDRASRELRDVALGELVPEFRYRFLFLSARDAVFDRAERLGEAQPDEARNEADKEIQMAYVRKLRDDLVPLNAALLRAFLDYLVSCEKRVVIVEGRLNPVALDSHPPYGALNAKARFTLVELSEEYDRVHFLPADSLPPLTTDDYVDVAHVTLDMGLKLSKAIVARAHALAHGDSRRW